MFNNIHRLIAVMVILALFVSVAAGAVVTQDVEIRGSVADGNETYDYTSFAGFWYDLDENQSSEVMTVNITGERTIDERDLVYTCTRKLVDYENSDLNDTYEGYYIIGFMAEKYICYDGNTDELVKLLVEWGSSDEAVLSINDPMELPEGYMLTAQEIDLQGDRVWLKLYQDGECVDDSIVLGGDAYTYEDEDDVLVLGLTVDSVFRGTESNLVTISGIFLRSADILDVDTGEDFGVMEVTSTTATTIVLKNDESIDLGEDDEVEIMDGLYFKVADDPTLRYYLAKTIVLECDECPEMPVCPVCPEPEPCPEVTPVNTTDETIVEPEAIVDVEPEDKPTAVPTKKTLPGFEAVFAIAGLLAVAYLVLKQRE